jgi:SAM-dependent methyltransferase
MPEPDDPDAPDDVGDGSVRPVRRWVDEAISLSANRADWDAYADEYQRTHGDFLGDAGFIWGPEGLREDDVHLLGDVAGRRVLEVGCGAAQCARWVRRAGGRPWGVDVSFRQLQHAQRLNEETGTTVPTVCATATALPFVDDSFDVVFSSFGGMQFVADANVAVAEAGRVLTASGRLVFSVTHPVRWAMPDDPGEAGLRVTASYFDRTPYVEVDEHDRVRYAEHHRTIGDWVRTLAAHGFRLVDLLEPEWPPGHDRVWGGWGPLRGALLPGTAIFVADRARS